MPPHELSWRTARRSSNAWPSNAAKRETALATKDKEFAGIEINRFNPEWARDAAAVTPLATGDSGKGS
jgi:hypothetical protein